MRALKQVSIGSTAVVLTMCAAGFILGAQPVHPIDQLKESGTEQEDRAATARKRLCSLYVTVESEEGFVEGLRKEDLRLYVDGQPRSFRLAKAQGPATIALLAEYSERSLDYLSDIQSSMRGFQNYASEGHWYALATFAYELSLMIDFTKAIGKISSGFVSLPPPTWKEINTCDAIYEMLVRMERIPGRRILIFVGSGLDMFSRHSPDEVLRRIESNSVVVYVLGVGSSSPNYCRPSLRPSPRLDWQEAEAFLDSLAVKSGGRALYSRCETTSAEAMKGIMQDIENQYQIVYEPGKSSGETLHKIQVEVVATRAGQGKKLHVRARKTWRY